MTAVIVEGVSCQDLDDMAEATCAGDDNPAIAVYGHAGKCMTPICATHESQVRAIEAKAKAGRVILFCIHCGQNPLDPATIEVRPI